MLIHPTLDQLQALGLQGMAKAFTELDKHGDAATLSHAEWLALLLDRETTWRTTRGSAHAFDTPNCGIRPHLRMSTTGAPAASSAGCSKRC
jgi:hypothetical protein